MLLPVESLSLIVLGLLMNGASGVVDGFIDG